MRPGSSEPRRGTAETLVGRVRRPGETQRTCTGRRAPPRLAKFLMSTGVTVDTEETGATS